MKNGLLQFLLLQQPVFFSDPLALLLLVLGVFADYHNMSLTLDDLALFADHFNGRPYLHRWFLLFGIYDLLRQVMRPLVRS